MPFFIIEVLLRNPVSTNLLLASAIGFTFPLMVLALITLIRKYEFSLGFPPFQQYQALRFSTATFGGGNRGTAFFILLFSQTPHFDEYLTWFTLVDLGNFICQYTIIVYLIYKVFGTKQQGSFNWSKIILGNYAVTSLIVVAIYFVARNLIPSLDIWLSDTVAHRKFTFSALVFCAITVRFNFRKLQKGFAVDLSMFYLSRILTLAIFTTALYPFYPESKPLILALGVLSLMPPSSAITSMLAQTNASQTILNYSGTFSVIINLIYLILLVPAGLLALAGLSNT